MKFSTEIVCVNCQHKQHEMFSLDELPLQKQYAEAVKMLEEMAVALDKVCKRNDIGEAVLDYYGDCAMARDNTEITMCKRCKFLAKIKGGIE